MQIFDSLTIAILLIVVLAKYFQQSKSSLVIKSLAVIALVSVAIQLTVEGYRWQMVPGYIVLAIVVIQCWFAGNNPAQEKLSGWRKFRHLSAVSIALLLVASSALFSYLFPMFDLPEPTGSYTVGTSEFHMIDETRPETYTEDISDKRELMVRVWYPADKVTDKEPTPYWREAALRSAELTKGLGMPGFLFDYFGNVATHSYWDVPLSNTKPNYPVLIFSHGFNLGWASQNTNLMESLASHGYIIFSIDHAYVGMASIFPDGRVAKFNKQTFASMSEPPSPEVMAINEQLSETSNWRAQIALLNKANAMMPEGSMDSMNETLAIWAEDQLFVLSEIEKFQSGEKASATSEVLDFKSHLDLSNLGFFGMSFGGSTSLDNCVKDSRCKAGINMDGFMASQMQLPPLQKPFMFMNSEDNLLYNAMYEIAESDVYSVRVEGSNHLNYLDFSIMSPLYKMMGVLGQIEGYKMLAITEDYVLGFFDKYLKDETSALLDDSADNSVGKYKEVEFRKKSKKH